MPEENENPEVTIICLVPVKNEQWILHRFLQCTSLWADHIIVADQGSTDKSVEIAKGFEKVILVENKDETYNEGSRQRLLLEKAREIPVPGKRLLIALDADEIFSGNVFTSNEWKTIIGAPSGSVIRFNWAQLNPDYKTYIQDDTEYMMGFMDDDTQAFDNRSLHNPRLPIPSLGNHLNMKEIKVMHFNNVIPARDRSKKRWYMCYERVEKNKDSISINRSYIDMFTRGESNTIPDSWFNGYSEKGVDMTSVNVNLAHVPAAGNELNSKLLKEHYWWDDEVLEFFNKYGVKRFAPLDIWDVNWTEFAKTNSADRDINFDNPQNLVNKLVLKWLKMTQNFKGNIVVRLVDKVFHKFTD